MTELAAAAGLLAEARLLTLTGPGGAGKTRLALHLASAVANQYPDGVWFVDFSPLAGRQFVWDQVASALGLMEPAPGRSWAEMVTRHVGPLRALLLLDNCEHLVQSVAEAAAALLSAAPALKMIATSREPLGVGGEVTWTVPPLVERDAVQLFTDRAQQAWPQFNLDDAGREAVLDICRRLDGLPLAIELAAARTRALDPVQIAAGLNHRFALLSSGPRTAPKRQSTLAASFDWSYELLSEPERALLRRLSVFTGGFHADAAMAVCPSASMELLAGLTDRSLLLMEGRGALAGPRYRMLETIRQFAAEYLDEAQELELLRTRHRDHYLQLAEAAAPQLFGPDQDRWYTLLRAEQDNLRAALAWSRDQGEAEALTRMVVALVQFWAGRGRFLEALIWIDAAAAQAGDVPSGLRAWVRVLQAWIPILAGRGSMGEVPAFAVEARDLARDSEDEVVEAMALLALGIVAGVLSGAEAMRPYLDEALPLARSSQLGGDFAQVLALMAFVMLRWFQSDPEETRRLADQAIAIARSAQDRHALLGAIWIAGLTAVVEGRLDEAALLFEAALAEGRKANDTVVWDALVGLAWVAMFRGELATARARAAEGLAAAQESEAEAGSVKTVGPLAKWIVGWIDLAEGSPDQASASLAAVIEALRSSPFSHLASVPLVLLAEAQLSLGALDEAEASLEEATSLAHSRNLTWVWGRTAQVRAKMRTRDGDLREAETLAAEGVALGREAGDRLGLVDALELLARLAAEQERHNQAARLWAAAESRRAELGYRFAIDPAAQEAAVARTKQALGPDDFASAWAEGSKLSLEDAIAYATRGRGERRRSSTGWASLTPSELEVVRLVGQHLSNPEIARRLFVSRSTVKSHLLHIFAKLGIDSRSQLAAEASRHEMGPQRTRRG